MSSKAARLIEIELRVADLERSLRFYRDLVGLLFGEIETHGGSAPHAHVTWGDWDEKGDFLMVSLNSVGDEAPKRSRLGFGVDELQPIHERLANADATVLETPRQRPWGLTAAYEDPDGNALSLIERPRPAASSAAHRGC